MTIKLRDLYRSLYNMQSALHAMDIDVDNISCYKTRTVVDEELIALTESYLDLYNAEITVKVNIDEIIEQLNDCLGFIE